MAAQAEGEPQVWVRGQVLCDWMALLDSESDLGHGDLVAGSNGARVLALKRSTVEAILGCPLLQYTPPSASLQGVLR